MLLLVPLLLQVAQPLRTLFDEEWDYEMRASPEAATALGDNRFNDRLDDRSLRAIQADAGIELQMSIGGGDLEHATAGRVREARSFLQLCT